MFSTKVAAFKQEWGCLCLYGHQYDRKAQDKTFSIMSLSAWTSRRRHSGFSWSSSRALATSSGVRVQEYMGGGGPGNQLCPAAANGSTGGDLRSMDSCWSAMDWQGEAVWEAAQKRHQSGHENTERKTSSWAVTLASGRCHTHSLHPTIPLNLNWQQVLIIKRSLIPEKSRMNPYNSAKILTVRLCLAMSQSLSRHELASTSWSWAERMRQNSSQNNDWIPTRKCV